MTMAQCCGFVTVALVVAMVMTTQFAIHNQETQLVMECFYTPVNTI